MHSDTNSRSTILIRQIRGELPRLRDDSGDDWGERQIRSVANMTRQDAREFLKIAHDLRIRPQVTEYRLENVNKALLAVKAETDDGSAVIVP